MIHAIKSVFRPIYVPVINKQKMWKNRIRFLKYIGKSLDRRAYVVGSPLYNNLGDSAILIAEIRFLIACGWREEQVKEITYQEYYENRKYLKRIIKNTDILFGLGGGNMGNQWQAEENVRYSILEDYPSNQIIIFPQTIYFGCNSPKDIEKSKLYYNSHHNLTLVAREVQSYSIMKELYPEKNILLSPDIVLSAAMCDFKAITEERNEILFVTRSDAERSVDDMVWKRLEEKARSLGKRINHTDMYSDIVVTKENRSECVRKKMQEFCKAELVITDRLHGMVFAALTETPCIVFSNYNHKVKGTYDWISYLSYVKYCEKVEEAIELMPILLENRKNKFISDPLQEYFTGLKNICRENIQRAIR